MVLPEEYPSTRRRTRGDRGSGYLTSVKEVT